MFLKYEENGLGEDVAKKLRDISIRAGQSGANYVDSVKNLEIEHQPSWDYLGRLDPKGEEQVKGGTRIASNLRWVEKNGMFKWKFDATVKRSVNDDQFVLVDPLDAPLYSYEIPVLTKLLILLSKKINKWMKYDYDAKKDYIDHNGNWNNDGLIDWGPLKTDNTSDNKPKNKENTLNNGDEDDKGNREHKSTDIVDMHDSQTSNNPSAKADEPWDGKLPDSSFYYLALYGKSLLGVKEKLFGNVQERINRLERMNHEIFLLPGHPPKPYNAKEQKQEANSKDGDKKKKNSKKKKVKGSAFCAAYRKYPRYKFRVNLRFLADYRLYLGLFTIYVMMYYFLFPMYNFLTGGDEKLHHQRKRSQKGLGYEKRDGVEGQQREDM